MAIHHITNRDTINRTGVCSVCGPTDIKHFTKHGKCNGWLCGNKVRESHRLWKLRKPRIQRPYRVHAILDCDLCSFHAVDVCQMDIHHIDGNHDNNSMDNLQSLCSNCHRIVTKLQRISKQMAKYIAKRWGSNDYS